jgi:ATP-binding protein involved in chromosome partitioning
VLLVASGKGGVGKSTVTANLACALAASGLAVGILDADLFGPSVALLMGSEDAPAADDKGRAVPVSAHGIPVLSVANVLPPEAALAWKGPLASQAIEQMFRDVAWPALDVLLVDLPPGTGDIHLTILERLAVSGAVVVTTPQKMATIDAERGISLFHEYDIPVFGLVENMAGYVCPCCGELQYLFPKGNAAALARRRHVALLGSIPLDPEAQAASESGTPLVLGRPDSSAAVAIRAIAAGVASALDRESKARHP